MAKRPESQLVLAALELVDADFMREAECWFGGGTAVALRCNEFRISHDIDFLCSSRAGYRLLRQRVHAVGVQAIFAAEMKLIREVRADICVMSRPGERMPSIHFLSPARPSPQSRRSLARWRP